jgi:hypothetical protein
MRTLAVRQAAAPVPRHLLDEAVDVLLELPRNPGLADAGDADHGDEVRLALLAGRMKELLDEAQLAVAADERRLEAVGPERAATRGEDAHRPREPLGLGSSLQRLLAGVLVGERGLGRAPRRLADEDRARLGRRLDPRRRVDEVARDHALPGGAERHRGLAGEHPGARLQRRSQLGHRGDQIKRCPHGAFGVVLLRHRRPPHRHDGVTDEFLDRAAIALDQRPRRLEIARQQFARLLRIATLGGGREADQVGEQHRHESALSRRLDYRRGGHRRPSQRRAALVAERLACLVRSSA